MYLLSHSYHKSLALAALIAVAALITGCGDEPGSTKALGESAVNFGAYVSGVTGSRSGESNIHSLKRSGFGVFASLTWADNFADSPSATPNYMYNQRVEWKGFADSDSAWVYDPVMFWPGMQKVSFFAYAPYTAGSNSSITSLPGATEQGNPQLAFTLGNVIDKQVDLLYANALNLVNSPQVPLAFKHALSQISVKFSVDSSIDKNTTFTINSLTIKSDDLRTAGRLDLCSGTWTADPKSAPAKFSFNPGDDLDSRLQKGFMVIPASAESTIDITANYTVTTTDAQLKTGKFETTNELSKTFRLSLEGGKSYCLNLKLTLHSIEVSASVKDWDDNNYKWESNQEFKNELKKDEQS